MKRDYSIRTRTAVIIAVSFVLLITLFLLFSYLSTKAALIDRSESEARSQLRTIITALEDSTDNQHLIDIIERHNTIGESVLGFSLYTKESRRLKRIHTSTNNKELPLSEAELFSVILDSSKSLSFSTEDNNWDVIGLSSKHFAGIATINMVVIEETREAMLRQFGIVLAIGVLVSTALGFVLAELSLSPIRKLIDAARKLQSPSQRNNPSLEAARRLPVPEGISEVALLAKALNGLIDDRERSIAQLRDFTADAAHELRTPLTVLKGELEVELKFITPADSSHAVFRSNLEEVERLIALVEDLLILAKLDQNESASSPELQDVRILELLRMTIERLASFAESKQIAIRIDAQADPSIPLNSDRIGRLFYNIIHNAITYSEPGGHVRVTIGLESGNCVVQIRDNGIGITPDDLAHVFDRFYRAEKSRSRAAGGAGLGLAIAKSIAEVNNIAIGIDSTLGMGTCVTLSIPLIS